MDISILYEDNHLLVVEKPVNIPVQGDASRDVHMVDLLKEDLKVRYNKPGKVYLGLIHRLDRPVGGVMVFAKTSKAASRLSDLMRRQEMERTYLAIVHGRMPQESGKLVDYLYKDRNENKVYPCRPQDYMAKKAVLTYEQLHSEGMLSLVRVKLHTGRPHQIRFQLAHASCPIFGDQKYGELASKRGSQIALWSHELEFKHPTRDEQVKTVCSPPAKHPWNIFDLENLSRLQLKDKV